MVGHIILDLVAVSQARPMLILRIPPRPQQMRLANTPIADLLCPRHPRTYRIIQPPRPTHPYPCSHMHAARPAAAAFTSLRTCKASLPRPHSQRAEPRVGINTIQLTCATPSSCIAFPLRGLHSSFGKPGWCGLARVQRRSCREDPGPTAQTIPIVSMLLVPGHACFLPP